MRRHSWLWIILLFTFINLLFLIANTHFVSAFNYQELSVELLRLPVWLFLIICIEQLRKLPTIYPWLVIGTISMFLGNLFNVNDEIFNLEHPYYQIFEDILLTIGAIFCGIGFYKLIKQLIEQNILLKELATKDPLTGLANRRSFFQNNAIENSVNHEFTSSFLLLDIDNFNEMVKHHGKSCGDFVLIKLAELIGSVIRKQDRVIRWGGKEFVIELGGADIQTAQIKAEHIRLLMADNYINYAGNSLKITLSIGVSEYNGKVSQRKSAISRAEKALLLAKEDKNSVKIEYVENNKIKDVPAEN